MADSNFNLSELEVVGYASVLDSTFVPRIVAPIFSSKQLDLILMPPYRLTDTQVCEVNEGCQQDLQRAVRSGQVTLLAPPIEARSAYHLWIDENIEPRYEPASQVEQHLRQLARSKVRAAQEALAERNLDDALRLAQTAISADDTCLNAILIKACVYQYLGASGKVRILARIAESIAPGADLRTWAELFADLMQKQSQPTKEPKEPWPLEGGSIAVGREQDLDTSFTDQLLASHRILNSPDLVQDQDIALSALIGVN